MPRPTNEAIMQKNITAALTQMADAMASQATLFEKLFTKLEERTAANSAAVETARKIEISAESDKRHDSDFIAADPPTDEPGVVFKSKHRGHKQVIKQSINHYLPTGKEVEPCVIIDFAPNGTARLTDPAQIEGMRQKIAKRAKKRFPPEVIELQGEVAERCADPATDVRGIPSELIGVDTPIEEVLGVATGESRGLDDVTGDVIDAEEVAEVETEESVAS